MKYYFSLFIIVFTSTTCFAQNTPGSLEKLINEMATHNTYTGMYIGGRPVKTPQWKRFEKLKKLATEKELIALTNHSNTVVSCYAFQALAEKEHPETFFILLKHLKSNDAVSSLFGCLRYDQLVGDFFLNQVAYRQLTYKKTFRLTSQQTSIIDSILLFDPEIRLTSKSRFLKKGSPRKQFYNRIRQIYLEENNPSALIALSKFQNQKDQQFIIDWLNKKDRRDKRYGLQAVKYYPAGVFYPYLKTLHQQIINNSP